MVAGSASSARAKTSGDGQRNQIRFMEPWRHGNATLKVATVLKPAGDANLDAYLERRLARTRDRDQS
jgi:hypothetical protein